MRLERLKNSKRNVVFGLVNKMILLVFPFVIRTLILRLLSSEYAGLSSLFTSILSVLNLAELGFGSALVFNMYKPLASDDMEAVRALLNFYKKVYRVIGCAVLILGLIVLPFINHFISGQIPDNMNVYLLFAIYLVDAALTYFLFPYSGCVVASLQRTDIESNIVTAVYTVMYIGQTVVLCTCRNLSPHITYYLYILLQPIFNSVLCIVRALVVRRTYPEFYCKGKPDKAVVKDVAGRVKALFGHKLGTVVLYSFDSIVVSAFLDLNDLAVFNNYYLIHASVLGILQVGYNAIKAGIGNSIVLDDRKKNFQDFQRLTFLNFCVVGWCTVLLFGLYNRFMYFWMDKDMTMLYGEKTVMLLCLFFYFNSLRWIVITYKDAAGVWKEDAAKPYVESAVNLILNIALIQTPLGVNGVVLASIVSVALVSGPWETIVLLKTYFKQKPLKYYLRFLVYTAVNVAVFAVSCLACRYLASGYEVKDFLIRIALLVAIPAALYAAVYFRYPEFRASFEMLKRKIKKRSDG